MSENSIDDMSFKIADNLCMKMLQYNINNNDEESDRPKTETSS